MTDGIIERGATLTWDGVYRYELIRSWGFGGTGILWIMCNPSTADHEVDDHTIRCCVRFSRAFGARRLKVVNLFALRTPSPAELASHDCLSAYGPENAVYLENACRDQWNYPMAIAAWGSSVPRWEMTGTVIESIVRLRKRLFCLGMTADGSPRHPSRMSADATPLSWRG